VFRPTMRVALQDGKFKGWTPEPYSSEDLKKAKSRVVGRFVMPMEWRAHVFESKRMQEEFREATRLSTFKGGLLVKK